jgi:hypothetical protein
MVILKILPITYFLFAIVMIGGEIFAAGLYEGSNFPEAFLFIVFGVVSKAFGRMFYSSNRMHIQLKNLLTSENAVHETTIANKRLCAY